MAEKKTFFELVAARFDSDGVQASSSIGSDGLEYPDPLPLEPPVGYRKPPDVMDLIRSMVRNERIMAAAEAEGYETFDEAEDFDIEDDPLDPLTEYEKVFEPQPGALVAGANGGVSEPTTAPPVEANKPAVSGEKPSQVASPVVSGGSEGKSGIGSSQVSEK